MPWSQEQIYAGAADGALVLTANRRLFRHLREGFDWWMQERGRQAWSTPQIYSYEGWLSMCLDELGLMAQLLSSAQTQCLWEELIIKSSRGTSAELLQLPQTAERALQAHHLLSEYGVDLDPSGLTEDQQAFSRWRRSYLDYCDRDQLFDKSSVAQKVCEAIINSEIELPGQLYLIGFDQLSPGLKQLQQVAEKSGRSCLEVAVSPAIEGEVRRFAAIDRNDEIESAARWTRKLLEQGAGSIGIVVPDLVLQRRKIERIFRDQIDPESSLVNAEADTLFSLSLGGALAEEGVIHAALQMLQAGPSMTIDQVSFLLRTPYLGGGSKEADARALFDRKLRSFKQQRFSLSGLISMAEKGSKLIRLVEVLTHLRDGLNTNNRLPGDWAREFSAQLSDIGWPGDRSVNSREYQAVKSWQLKVLELLPTLDRIIGPVSRSQGLSLLRRLSNDTDFQLEGPNGQVQVVGLLESSGLNFQHLWVMGLEDRVFPAPPQPNPFLPYRLQEELQMPHASAERELLFAEQVIERLKAASPDIVFSHPGREGDSSLRPSPLIRDIEESNDIPLAAFADPLHMAASSLASVETLEDDHGPAVQAEAVKGGTSLLKDQAHCPFRAYVHHRLQCRALEEAAPGIAAMARGDLVHLTLENIWKKLKGQSQLLALSDRERDKVIHDQIEKAVCTYYGEGAKHLQPADTLMTLEKERLQQLVCEWLTEVEMKRDDFDVVATEQELDTEIGPLSIHMKVDRIDCLGDGSRIVIDYKTGLDLHADDFLTQPLIEPQLPIYAISDEASPASGVVFAQLRKGTYRFIGLVSRPGLLGRVRDCCQFPQTEQLGIENWTQLLAYWHQQVHQLGRDFAAGLAVVKPFKTDKSCRYCDLAGICRIDDVVSLRGESDES